MPMVKEVKPVKVGNKREAENNGKPAVPKRRAKSPEIFAHNMRVLRKKSAMRRRKLAKEVKVVKHNSNSQQ